MYWALVRLSFQRQLAYRTANLAGLATNLFFGALRAYVLIALFGAQENVAGYSVRDAITYTGITQAMLSFLSAFGWWEVIRSVRSGQVGTDLARPVDYFWYWAAQDLGRGFSQLLMRGLPLIAVYAVAYRISLPPTAAHWAALPLSLTLGLLIGFSWRFLYNLAAFWTVDAMGVGRLATTVAMFLSGFLMPIAFFPPWAEGVMRLLPFASMVNTPVEVYLGVVRGPALVGALLVQLGWAAALVVLARTVLASGLRRLVIQGG
ncbi:MAG: ABC transporter permease [Anaerolineae bacterium]|nr:ABC transporter permease [Anaerolineae bacterium]